MSEQEILQRLRALADPVNAAGMARFGITPIGEVLGVSVPALRRLAKEIGKDNTLALKLWSSGIHEACVLTAFIGKGEALSETDMERLVMETDSWDVCDQLCGELFTKHPLRFAKAAAWSEGDEEFVRRSGFSLMARLAVRDKKAADEEFIKFLPLIEKHSTDERNMVKKAVNWALRQIGKRNLRLHSLAVTTAEKVLEQKSKTARWIASDALRELSQPKIVLRIKA
jgi:3-methyladenine DNA glycosylase AlkD